MVLPTIMPFTQFKLVQTGRNALTRRVTFAEQPTWFSLASRIEQLCGIPLQDVGVSYIDSDRDEITLSTHEELEDYYATVPHHHNEAIKFTVKSIGALRAENRSRPQHPSSNNNNNMYEIIVDEDWQPDMSGLFARPNNPPPPPPKSPSSAFVETVESSDTVDPVAPDNRTETSSVPVLVTDNKEHVRKGKRPLYEGSDASDASSVSVIHDDMPNKQPVHVMEFDTERGYVHDRSYQSYSKSSRRSRQYSPVLRASRSISRSDSSSRSPSPVIRPRPLSRSRSHSPSVVVRIITPPPFSRGSPSVNVDHLADPPSPVFKSSPIPVPRPVAGSSPSATATLPSLGNDVAELLSALTSAFASHPELSEGLKNIVRNASQGAYWAAERDVMVNDALRAAETAQDGIARAAHHAQEEAGRKVSEALSGVFRALGSIINSTTSQGSDHAQPQSYANVPRIEIHSSRGRSRSRSPPAIIYPSRHSSQSANEDTEMSPGAYIVPSERFPTAPMYISRIDVQPANEDRMRPKIVIMPTQSPPPPVTPSRPSSQPVNEDEMRPKVFIVPTQSPASPVIPSRHPSQPYRRSPSPPIRDSRTPEIILPPRSRSLTPPARDFGKRETSPDPYMIPPPPRPGHYESRRSPFYYGHYHPGPPPPPPRPHYRYPFPGPPPPAPPPGPPPRSSSPNAMFHHMYPPMWAGLRPLEERHHGLRRSSTLPSSYGPPRIGGPLSGPAIRTRPPITPYPVGTMVTSDTAQRKAELEEAKQYYKAKKEEWRRERESRRLEKEKRESQRMERTRERDRRAARQVVVFDNVEEAPPPVPPHPAELVNSSPPREAMDGEVTDFTNQRPSGGDRRHWVLMSRLAGMGFTPKTHPQLEALLGKHLRQQVGSRSFTEEAVIANLMEELFHPQGDGAGSRPEDRPGPSVNIPGAWGV